MEHYKSLPALALSLALFGGTAATAQDAPADTWQWGAEIYFWGASLGGDTTSDTDVELDIGTILEDLNMGAMGTIAARKEKLSFFGDLIYLNLGDKGDSTGHVLGRSVDLYGDIQLKGVISTLGAGYQIVETPGTTLDVVGGLRYLWLDSTIKLDVGRFSGDTEFNDSNFDGIIGLRGQSDLNENWYVNYYADVGTGQSDLTWQAALGVNYRMG